MGRYLIQEKHVTKYYWYMLITTELGLDTRIRMMLTGARALSRPVSERLYKGPKSASVRLLNSADDKKKNKTF
jgi:hypothetical protein